jgi:hypothetical protein
MHTNKKKLRSKIFSKKAKTFTQNCEGVTGSQRKSLRVLPRSASFDIYGCGAECVSAPLRLRRAQSSRALFLLIPARSGWVVIASALVLFALGCASTTAPLKWLSPPRETQRLAYGGWISANYTADRKKSEAHGELLAIHTDSLFVLAANNLIAIPLKKITKAKLTAYDANTGPLTAWSVLGTLSTASHGFGLIISAPVWIISGTAATSAQSYAPQLSFPKKSWGEFRKYARFPNGLPPNIDRRALRSKSVSKK